MTKPYLSIITPAYQNEDYIEQTIDEIYRDIINRANFSTELIVAEDGSTDRTREILKKLQTKYGFQLICDPQRKGHIKATKELYDKARGKYILFMDSDGECHPNDFWLLFDKIKKNHVDLVVGYRKNRKPIYRNIISKIESIIGFLFFGFFIRDFNCPFRITKKEVSQQIIPQSGQLRYNFNFEQIIRANKLGYNITQVGVSHRPRKSIISPPNKIAAQTLTAFIEIVKFRFFWK